MKKIIFTSKAPAAIGPYSQAIETGNTLYISGQVPVDSSTGKVVEGRNSCSNRTSNEEY